MFVTVDLFGNIKIKTKLIPSVKSNRQELPFQFLAFQFERKFKLASNYCLDV